MSTKTKLIVAMLVIGGIIAGLNTILIALYTHDQAVKNVEQLEASNAQAQATNADLEKQIAKATGEEKTTLEKELVEVVPVGWIDRNDWIIMTAWVVVFQFGMLGAAALVLARRDDSLPFTWGESIFYGFVLFGFLIIAFGFIPHYIISIWDFKTGTWVSPFSVWPTRAIAGLWNENALGWQWSWKAVRDIIVAGWYIVALLAMYVLWYWAQEFPKRQAQKAATTELTSPYGRPMLSTEK